jgi:hypothetical protein
LPHTRHCSFSGETILRFLQALETIEADLWRQYAALGGAGPDTRGTSPIDLPFPNGLADLYVAGVQQLDGDMPQYISTTRMTVDTTWWTRYRSATKNPDLGDTFPDNAIPDLAVNQHTAIPRTNNDLIADPNQLGGVSKHTQAIANTAGFHFGFIEQGGSSLYPQLAQRVTNVQVCVSC